MTFTIKAHKFFVAHSLAISEAGLVFQNTAISSGKRNFNFNQIDCVLLSEKNVLSFQANDEVFSIPTQPDNPQHQEAVDAMVKAIQSSNPSG